MAPERHQWLGPSRCEPVPSMGMSLARSSGLLIHRLASGQPSAISSGGLDVEAADGPAGVCVFVWSL